MSTKRDVLRTILRSARLRSALAEILAEHLLVRDKENRLLNHLRDQERRQE